MNRHRLIKVLRIAWTAGWCALSVLIIVAWVRSYWWMDGFGITDSWSVASLRGELLFSFLDDKTGIVGIEDGHSTVKISKELDRWNYYDAATPTWDVIFARGARLPGWFHLVFVKFLTLLIIPVAIALFTCPWIHWTKSFSLRTLLIATTIIAIMLGLVVWTSAIE